MLCLPTDITASHSRQFQAQEVQKVLCTYHLIQIKTTESFALRGGRGHNWV